MQAAVLTTTASVSTRRSAQSPADELASGVPAPFPRALLALQTGHGSIRLPTSPSPQQALAVDYEQTGNAVRADLSTEAVVAEEEASPRAASGGSTDQAIADVRD